MRFEFFDLGLVDFNSALQRQKEVFGKVKNGDLEGALIFCRHHPVITCGRQADKNNILKTIAELTAKGIESREIERGGSVTYHGPGQIIAYPVFNLNYLKKDIHFFLRRLEDVVLGLLTDYGVSGRRKDGYTGVWIGEKKISSIGIAIKNWITFHGVSINIKKDDLTNYRIIKPCGLDIEMTSLESILAAEVNIEKAKENLLENFSRIFSISQSQFPLPKGEG